jgi:hypothetical protein
MTQDNCNDTSYAVARPAGGLEAASPPRIFPYHRVSCVMKGATYDALHGRAESGDGTLGSRGSVAWRRAAWERGTGDLTVEGRLQDDQLSGSMVTPEGNHVIWSGRRAPALRRSAPPA